MLRLLYLLLIGSFLIPNISGAELAPICLIRELSTIRRAESQWRAELIVARAAYLSDVDRGKNLSAFLKQYKSDNAFFNFVNSQEVYPVEDAALFEQEAGRLLDEFNKAGDLARAHSAAPAAKSLKLNDIDLLVVDSNAVKDGSRNHLRWMNGQNSVNQPAIWPVNYERRVLALRTGDSVAVKSVLHGNKEYTLNAFLGAGNTSHVFAVADSPDVIKIPFATQAILNRHGHYQHPVHGPREFFQKMIAKKEAYQQMGKTHGFKVVEIKDWAEDGSFMVVERVNPGMNGVDAVQALKNYSEVEKGAELLKAIEAVAAQERIPLGNGIGRFWDRYEQIGRQFVWDLDSKQWVLVDWE